MGYVANINQYLKKFNFLDPHTSSEQESDKVHSHLPFLSKHFLIILIVILFVAGLLPAVGMYFILQSKFQHSESFIKSNRLIQTLREKIFRVKSPPSVAPSQAPWKTYEVGTLGLEFQLPPALSKTGDIQEEFVPQNGGIKVCVTLTKKPTSAMSQASAANNTFCNADNFGIGATSRGYTATPSSEFLDLQGFVVSAEKYYAILNASSTFWLPQELIREVRNPNKVVLLKVTGANDPDNATNPRPGTPGEGWIGALINLPNETYPGLAIQLKLSEGVTEEDFDELLSTIKLK